MASGEVQMDNNFTENNENQVNDAPAMEQPVFTSGINYESATNEQGPQTTYQQPVYQQPVYAQANPQNNEPVSIGTWLGIMFISLIPCVNIIMLFVWAFSEGKESRKNWAKAQLIFLAIVIGIYTLLMFLFGATLVALINEFAGMY